MNLIIVGLALLGGLCLLVARVLWGESGIPEGQVIYSDADGRGEVLVSRRFGLIGKPDYLMRSGGYLIPVEIKPTRIANRPYRSDLLQLAAYGLLVEDTYGTSPPYGIIRYRSGSHRIPLTRELRTELQDVLAAIRSDRASSDVAPNHSAPARCTGCGYRAVCGRQVGGA